MLSEISKEAINSFITFNKKRLIGFIPIELASYCAPVYKWLHINSKVSGRVFLNVLNTSFHENSKWMPLPLIELGISICSCLKKQRLDMASE